VLVNSREADRRDYAGSPRSAKPEHFPIARIVIVVGLVTAMIGLIWLLFPSLPWVGHLPGDIAVERGNFRRYFPLVTCILLSLIASALFCLIGRFMR